MPGKARPLADKPAESTDTPPTTSSETAGDDKPPTDVPPAVSKDAGNEPALSEAGAVTELPEDAGQPEPPKPGVYRFTWPYSCVYNLPGQTSRTVEPGEEVFWPDGAPDALWEFVSSDEPAPAPSDNT